MVCTEPIPDPSKFIPREGEAAKHAQRRRHADQEAEHNAVTSVAVYMLLMTFSQKGINKLRAYQEHLQMRHPDGEFTVSEGFDEGEISFSLVKRETRADVCCSAGLVQGPVHQV